MAAPKKASNAKRIDRRDPTADQVLEEKVTSIPEQENTQTTASHKATVMVTLDDSDEDIVQYDKNGVILQFDPERLRELDDDLLKELRYETTKNYFIAKAASERFKVSPRPPSFETSGAFGDPFSVDGVNREEVRNRPKGAHVTWKRPDEVDYWKERGFQPVTDENKGKMEFPYASRSGNTYVLKAQTSKGLVDDLVAMVLFSKDGVPGTELLRRHKLAMSRKSVSKFKSVKQEVLENLKEYALRDESNY